MASRARWHRRAPSQAGGIFGSRGGANTIVQFLNAGLVDEFSIAVAPVVFGAGIRLFEGVDRRKVKLEIIEALHSPLVTHLRYAVTARL
jgi:dihydrofolate reductase